MLLAKIVVLTLSFYNVPGSDAGTISTSISTPPPGTKGNYIIELPDSSLTKLLENLELTELTGDALATHVVSLLQQQTSSDQAPVIKHLQEHDISHTPFWIANRILIQNASPDDLSHIASLPHAFIIRDPYTAKTLKSEFSPPQNYPLTERSAQWGVVKINAPAVWSTGNMGQGIVVGITDTGVNVNHEALSSNYKGDGYSWYDAVNHTVFPFDDEGHGTHCAGIAVGTTNGIGVAPGAKWIACKGLNAQGSGTEANLLKCGQFMQCPSKTVDSNQTTCIGVPNIVSNSWGGSSVNPTWYNIVIASWQASGIIPLFAIGNRGPNCTTTGDPGNQPNLISVGSTEQNDTLSSFSSRGPNGILIKPDVSAPGRHIISADTFNVTGYITFSGTSMATPNVAGAVALILKAKPTYKYKDVYNVLAKTSVKPKLQVSDSSKVCSIVLPNLPLLTNYPNNGYGYGRIDVKNALGV